MLQTVEFRMNRTISLSIALLAFTSGCQFRPVPDQVFFRQDIAPILDRHCARCHGDKEQESRLELTSLRAVLTGGDSGPAIVPFAPTASLLLELVTDAKMPPQEPRLTRRQIDLLRRWIVGGAKD